MTVDKAIEQLQKLQKEGHGDAVLTYESEIKTDVVVPVRSIRVGYTEEEEWKVSTVKTSIKIVVLKPY